jgi:hypothetical protein
MSIFKPNTAPLQLIKIMYADINSVASIIKISDDTVQVNFKPNNNWLDFYSSPGRLQFEEKPKETDGGVLFEQQVSGTYPDANW